MKKRCRWLCVVTLLLLMFVLLGCAAPEAEVPIRTVEVAAEAEYYAEEEVVVEKEVEAIAAPAAGGEELAGGSGMETLYRSVGSDRMIIKDAQIRLLVEDADLALDLTTQIVSDVRGYIISSRVWYEEHRGDSYKYSQLTIGVPVDQFERTLRRLRDLSIKVLDENASGEDVTDQYVDLESELENLEATRDRIRGFLEQATTVEEALQVNEELSKIEGQIEEIKGRMNYLEDRAAFSTITITLEPQLADIPTPTPTLTPTPTPTPTPVVWKPGETLEDASRTLKFTYQGLVEALIWIFVVIVPVLAPFALIVWLLWFFLLRKKRKAGDPESE